MQAIKHECYSLVQAVTLKRHPLCRMCGKPSVVGHHLFTRSRLSTAFNPEALVALCNDCHAYAHAKPMLFKAVAKELLGDRYGELQAISRMTVQFRTEEYRKIKALLTALAEGKCE